MIKKDKEDEEPRLENFAGSVELRKQAKAKIPIKIPTKGKRNQNNNTNTNASNITYT